MKAYVLRRLLALAPVLIGVSFLAFGLGRLAPGDPAFQILQRERGYPPTVEEVARLRQELGLDHPLSVQYVNWVGRVLAGDLGQSYTNGTPVARAIGETMGYTLTLALVAAALSVVLALPAGMLAAARPRSAWDHILRLVSLVTASVPGYLLGYILILLFGVTLRWLPVAGATSPAHMVLPAVALALGPAAVQARLTRAAFLEVLGEDYMRTARAKGAGPPRIMLRHALRNAALPLITVFGLQVGHLLLGAVVVEVVFARPGLGKLIVDAIGQRDYPLLQGFVLLAGTLFVGINLIVDLLYGVLDPRIRLGKEARSA